MSADGGEEEAVVDVRVPGRRRRASDDEADEAEFHDAAEYAASISSHPEEHAVADLPVEVGPSDDEGGATGEPDEQHAEAEDEPANEDQTAEVSDEPKKAKIREPFEVPTSGAFWLHDDRFGEEVQAGPSRPSEQPARKAKSDTEGRWLHDKFSTLELEGDARDDESEDTFAHYRGGRGRGMRGGRRGGGARPPLGGRGRGGRSGRGYGLTSAEDQASDGAGDAAAALGSGDEGGALPQRPSRAPRRVTRDAAALAPYSDDQGAAGASEPASSGAGRGRGRSIRGGRTGEARGQGRGERSYSPEAGEQAFGGAAEANGGGRGYGRGAGRGRGAGSREEGPRTGSDYTGGGRGARDYDNGPAQGSSSFADSYGGGRGRGRGSARSPIGDDYDRGEGYDRGAGRGRGDSFGRGAGRGRGDSFGRSSGPGRGEPYGRGPAPGRGAGPGRGPAPQQRTLDDEFPPLPGSAPARPAAADARAGAGAGGADAGASATGGVRRYSKMAGKVAGGDGATGTETGRSRAAGADAAGGNRASKLSAAAPTFEPTPAGKDSQPVVPPVPAAFGAPLQPIAPVPATQPMAAPAVNPVPEAYGAPVQPQSQYMPHMQPPAQPHTMHQQQQPFQPPQPQMQAYGAPPMQGMPQQGPMAGHPQAPGQQPQQQFGGQGAPGASYGAYNDMESWFRDAYQKALATGMDPQQAYSAVQGYVQGMQMAFQTLAAAQQQQPGGYPGMAPPAQPMPQGP